MSLENFVICLYPVSIDWNTFIPKLVFVQVLGPISLTPFLGSAYNLYFPTVLVLLCLFNVLNLYTKCVNSCCPNRFRQFSFEEDSDDFTIQEGILVLSQGRTFVLLLEAIVQFSSSLLMNSKSPLFSISRENEERERLIRRETIISNYFVKIFKVFQ